MKKTLVFAVVVLCASPAWAVRFMGPPAPKGDAGQLSLGLDWSYSEFDVRSDDASGTAKTENDVYFARLLFGVADWAEISGGIGISDTRYRANGYRSGNDFAWGVGSKLRFWESGPVDLGAAFQLTSLSAHDETATGPFLTEGKLDAYIIEVAVGPSYETHGITVYGGPFVHFVTGDLEGKSGGVRTEIDIDEEESEFGGYFGLSAKIVKNTSLSLEYHITNDSYAIGFGLVHRFGRRSKPVPAVSSPRANSWPSIEKSSEEKPASKERLKTDANGEPVKDKDGNFVFVPVE